MMGLSASVYAADPFRLAEDIEAVLPYVESLHLDVMDGEFAPEYGVTARIIKDLSQGTDIPLDVHLMVKHPMASAIRFSEMGVRSVAIHVESEGDFREFAAAVRSNGAKVYAALRHTTPVSVLESLLDVADGCLLLTAPAGGGAFDEFAFERLSNRPKDLYTVVDGKIGPDHFAPLLNASVDVAVVGAALFIDGEARKRAAMLSSTLSGIRAA